MGLGAGIPIGQTIGQTMAISQAPQQDQTNTPAAKLKQLKELLDLGLISQSDFDEKKTEILKSI